MAVNLRGVTVVLLPGTGSDDDYVYRAFSAALHDVGAVVVHPGARAGPARRRLSARAGRRGAAGPDRGRRGVDRRRGGHLVGAGASRRSGRGRAGRAARLDGRTRNGDRRAGRPVLGAGAAPRRTGRRRSARCGRPARRGWPTNSPGRGSASGPHCPTPWTRPPATSRRRCAGAGDAGGAAGRRGGHRRSGAPGRGGARMGGRGAPRGAAHRSRSTKSAPTPASSGARVRDCACLDGPSYPTGPDATRP